MSAHRTLPRLLLAIVVTGAAACGPAPAPLTHTFDSPEALAAAVLDGLARRDAAGLQALAVTEAEFRARVWPELPASRPERNVPVEYAWGELAQKSRASLRETLARHGGRRYRLRRVEFLGDTTEYETFGVARKSQLVVEGPDGREQELRLFGSILRAGREYKVFSYVVD